jgi:hypothetical protein
MVGVKINEKMFHEFKMRLYEELDQHLADMRFTNSSLLHGEEELEGNENEQQHFTTRKAKRRRKEKQVVMFTDHSTGLLLRQLHPRMPLW